MNKSTPIPFTDELGTQIARHVYERSAEIWPHVSIEPAFVPAGYSMEFMTSLIFV